MHFQGMIHYPIFVFDNLFSCCVQHSESGVLTVHTTPDEDMLRNLFGNDSGAEIPIVELDESMNKRSDSVLEGKPYKWAQKVCRRKRLSNELFSLALWSQFLNKRYSECRTSERHKRVSIYI